MSAEPQVVATEPVPSWPVLNVPERRVLGVLVEKAKTTPDAYPLSVNALHNGCNQKSNRDPILDMTEDEVEDALVSVQKKGLAIKITGGRVVRWRHNLYETWHLGKVELAILGELLLRGPQTEGELRSRASRMEPIDDLESLRTLLRPLAERRVVAYLSPEGRRGTTLTHGFHAPEEVEQLRSAHKVEVFSPGPGETLSPPARARAESFSPASPDLLHGMQVSLAEARAEMNELRNQVGALQRQVAELTEQVRTVRRTGPEQGPAASP